MVGFRALFRFGAREWRLVRLTHQIHGHIGIYTTIGVKMGLYARESLGSPLSVVSFAGNTPPVSCMNDGLQIGADATLGHGKISVSTDPHARAEAEFRSSEKVLRLKLKPEYEERVLQDIRHGVEQFGSSPAYWRYVQSLALRYWREWDRNQIFEKASD